MVHKTIAGDVLEALDDLSTNEFERFCFQLLDRRDEPRVSRRSVEGKSVLEITQLLVSTFTETGARKVALEILRKINCNQVAEKLESKTKARVDNGDPTFRRTPNGELETEPSQEAWNHRAGQWPRRAARHGGPPVTVKKPEEVEAEAKARVRSEGGDPHNGRLVLSRCLIQFGQYKDKPFKWLLENDVGYTAAIVASHQMEREQTTSQSPLMVNKDSLTRYAIAYPEVLKEVRFHRECERAKERSLQAGQRGQALVGFGKYRSERLQDLYESKDKEKISYVDFLREKKTTCASGSRMEVAVRYVLQRDKERAAARRQTRGKRVQSTRSQFSGASGPIWKKAKRSWRRTNISHQSPY